MALLARLWIMTLLAVLTLGAAPGAAQSGSVQTAWRLLDYVAVDYREAVQNGRVVNSAEYAEMSEFSASVSEQLGSLPAQPAKAALIKRASDLQRAIAAKAAPEAIDKQARDLASALLAAYPVPLAPPETPDLTRGAALYRQNCASCHALNGDAKTPAAAKLDPSPIAFADRARARERSPFALYQVIDQGLEGTAMASFRDLPEGDKWALAFHAGRFAYPAALAAEGKRIWDADPALRRGIPDLAALASLTPATLAGRIGEAKATAVIAYLRGNPGVLAKASGADTLAVARERLAQSLAAYQAGDRDQAKALALSAYLDGFEPVEPMLAARDHALMARVEGAMAQVRNAIGKGRPVPEVRDRMAELDRLFADTEAALAPGEADSASAFFGALTILFREGLEALLIIVAMLTFLRRADRPEMVRPVHYGWVVALIAGLATWLAATHFLNISGAGRELTEGFGSILAALILLFVGIWMHGKAQADEWQRYIREKLGTALSGRSTWFLFALAFIAVYREVFETILFFVALSAQGNVGALAAGAATGLALLGAIAFAMFRFSARLPIGKFFAYSSGLIALLAVVLAGKGIAALQEAGLLGVTPLGTGPRIEILGIYPTLEGLAAQIGTLLVLLAGFAWNKRESRRLVAA
jgi:high-affinity iron transporter